MVKFSLPVLKIQRFSTHDGPGVRTTVFLKGCPLSCKWCHNPESQSIKKQLLYTESLCIGCKKCSTTCKRGVHSFGEKHEINREFCIACGECVDVCLNNALEICSSETTVDKILEEVIKDRAFYGKEGGLTLSGGEPLMHAEEVIELLKKAKSSKINTAVETSGYFDGRYIDDLVKTVDLFLFDIKDTDKKRHLNNTGVSNKKILDNLLLIDALGGKTILRCIVLSGVNDNKEHFSKVADIYKKLSNCKGVEIFSYHDYGVSKYATIGKTYIGSSDWVVSSDKLKEIHNFLRLKGVPCKIK